MHPKSYVDGFLASWGDGEYQAQVKMLRAHSKPASLPFAKADRRGRAGGLTPQTTEQKAQAVRERLERTTRRVPEVMVKIYSSCKGMRQAGRHMDYISRKGLLDLEDQDGLTITGKEQLAEVKDDWQFLGAEIIGDESERRDTLNIVFSMPAHTNEVSLKRAVRAFAAEAFDGHQYVMAYHTPTTDPDPEPPDHPHIHLSVKVQGRDGSRMNPRKADLQRWREGFASRLRENGVEANATSRLARLQRSRSVKRSTLALGAKGVPLHSVGRSGGDPARIERARKLEADRLAYYFAASHTLVNSEEPRDRDLGLALARHIAEGFDRDASRTNTVEQSKSARKPFEPER
jgi:hypothetical protein